MTIEVTNYFDVWGNKKDGWEINNWCIEKYNCRKFDMWDDKKLLRFMKKFGLINKNVRTTQIEFGKYCGNCIVLNVKKDGMPLYCVMEVEDV